MRANKQRREIIIRSCEEWKGKNSRMTWDRRISIFAICRQISNQIYNQIGLSLGNRAWKKYNSKNNEIFIISEHIDIINYTFIIY